MEQQPNSNVRPLIREFVTKFVFFLALGLSFVATLYGGIAVFGFFGIHGLVFYTVFVMSLWLAFCLCL